MITIPHVNTRYYHVPPADKSVAMCTFHGREHASAAWCPQMDPGWSEEQKQAYIDGFRSIQRAQRPDYFDKHMLSETTPA